LRSLSASGAAARGVPSPDQIRQIPLDEFFETFESLDDVFYVDQEPQAQIVTSPQ
jgi:hypothetical protein